MMRVGDTTMKLGNVVWMLLVAVAVVYMVRPGLIWRAEDAVDGVFFSEARHIVAPMAREKKQENRELKGLDQP